MKNERLIADEGNPQPPGVIPTSTLVMAGLLLLAVVWAYWPPLGEMAHKWWTDPQYSQGYVVPLFSAFLFWRRRRELAACSSDIQSWGVGLLFIGQVLLTAAQAFGQVWLAVIALACNLVGWGDLIWRMFRGDPGCWGVGLIFVGVALRLAGTALYLDWLEAISLLPVLWGAAVLLFGWHGLRHTWYAIAFLFFMIPLPYRVETGLSHPLQRIATLTSTYTLQTLGFPAFAEGNVIVLNDERIGIVVACNGLGMLMLFFAMAVGLAILIDRPLFDKFAIVASAVPIAILANTIRITTTTIISDQISRYWGDKLFHDYGGWVMMPIALGMLWVVVMLIDYLLPTDHDEVEPITPMPLGGFRTS